MAKYVKNIDKLEKARQDADDKRFNANIWRTHAKNGVLTNDEIDYVLEHHRSRIAMHLPITVEHWNAGE